MIVRIAIVTLLLLSPFSVLHCTDNGPLNVKYFQILNYRMGKDSAWQEPPRYYSIQFRGTPMKGWVEMNSHRQFHATWEIQSKASAGPISFTNLVASDYYVTRHNWTLENFEIAMTRLFPRLTSFRLNGDTLRMTGDADILLVQVGSLRQRVEDTWINDKDSNNVIVMKGGKCTWMNISGKDTSKVIYNYYAEDDREMTPGEWNLVCDYLEFSNLDTMFAFDVISAGSNLWLSRHGQSGNGLSFTRRDVLMMKKLHAADRDSITKICERNIPKLFIGPTNKKQALKELSPPEDVFADFEFRRQDSAGKKPLSEIRKTIHTNYADSLRRDIDSVTMEMRRSHFEIAKDSAVWHVSTSFTDEGDRHVAFVVVSLDHAVEGEPIFEVQTQFILLNGKWYMLPYMERFALSHYH